MEIQTYVLVIEEKICLVNIGNVQCTILYYKNKGTNANQSNI